MSEAWIGLVGVFVGALATIGAEQYRDWRRRRREAIASASLIYLELIKLRDLCLEIMWDDGTDEYGAPTGMGNSGEPMYIPQTDLPKELTFSAEANWTSHSTNILNHIIELNVAIKDENSKIRNAAMYCDNYRENIEVYTERYQSYYRIGKLSNRAIFDLRKEYSIGPKKTAKKEREEFSKKFEELAIKRNLISEPQVKK